VRIFYSESPYLKDGFFSYFLLSHNEGSQLFPILFSQDVIKDQI